MNKMQKFKPVIGLEVHIELATKSKMFCGCPADHFGKKPNTQTCPVCLGLPGALPVPNKEAIFDCIKLGLALNCEIRKLSTFDRKHYFYPDLPKGYQISQYDDPFCFDGYWQASGKKKIHIRRIHMEEDTAKLQHTKLGGKSVSLVDFNRSGVALVELVTEPEFDSAEEVVEFLKELQKIIRYLGISEADMEKGSLRLEANISVAKKDTAKLPDYKVELKNINSFRFIKKAIVFEIERQSKLLALGKKPQQETRGWSETKAETFSQRVKEEASDYKYFPDPDIPPIEIDELDVAKLKQELPRLPEQIRVQFKQNYNLPDNYIEVLTADPVRVDYFTKAASLTSDYRNLATLMVNQNLDTKFPEPAGLVGYLKKLQNTDYSSTSEVTDAVSEVLTKNQKAVVDYKNGKKDVVGFLIGQVQKLLKGKANPRDVKSELEKKLK